jgi:hypothetical protein
MQFVVRLCLVAFTTLAVAQSRALVFEGKAVISASDVAYMELDGGLVATRGGGAAGFCDFVAYQP